MRMTDNLNSTAKFIGKLGQTIKQLRELQALSDEVELEAMAEPPALQNLAEELEAWHERMTKLFLEGV